MVSKLTGQGSSQNRPFKPKIYQGKRRGQPRNYYDQDRYQIRYRSNSGDRRMWYRGRAQYGQNYRGRSKYDQNHRGDSRRGNVRGVQNYRGQNLEVDIEVTLEMTTLEEVELGLEKDSTWVTLDEMREAVVGLDQVQELLPIEIESDVLRVGSTIILPKTV